jgi:transposase
MPKRFTQSEFIAAYEASDSPQDVAEKLGVTSMTVKQTAVAYRKAGIPLRMFRRGPRKSLDVAGALNQIARIRGVTVETLQAEALELKGRKMRAAVQPLQ